MTTTWDDLLALITQLQQAASVDIALKEKQNALAAATAMHADIKQQVEIEQAKLTDLKAQNTAEVEAHQEVIAGLKAEMVQAADAILPSVT